MLSSQNRKEGKFFQQTIFFYYFFLFFKKNIKKNKYYFQSALPTIIGFGLTSVKSVS